MDKAGAQPLASDASGGFVECQSQYWSSLRHPVHPHFLVCKIFSFRNQDAYENSMMYVHCTGQGSFVPFTFVLSSFNHVSIKFCWLIENIN